MIFLLIFLWMAVAIITCGIKLKEITAMHKVKLLERYLEKYEDSDAVKCKYIRQILDPKAYGLEEEEE